jgi:hypothetical protein
MIKKYLSLLVLALLTFVVGCENKSTNITLLPDTLDDCKKPSEISVNWDVTIGYPNTYNVAIYVLDSLGKETLFAQGGRTGNIKTGSWVYPGAHFILRDSDTKQLIEDVSVHGPKCK